MPARDPEDVQDRVHEAVLSQTSSIIRASPAAQDGRQVVERLPEPGCAPGPVQGEGDDEPPR